MGFFDKFKTKFEKISRKKVHGVVSSPPEVLAPVTEKEDEKEAASAAGPVRVSKPGGIAYRVLEHPHVSEKTAEIAGDGKYVFAVHPKATKHQIREAMREVYGITPRAVNVIKRKGKFVRFGRFSGKQKDFKKAVVTLPKGKTLPIYE